MNKICIWSLLAFCFLNPCLQVLAAPLVGNFEYQSVAGAALTQGGSVVTYRLTITPTTCTLVSMGNQTDEEIRCKPIEQNNTTAINFASYADGTLANAYGAEVYKKDTTLFTLHKNNKKLITHWQGLIPDGVKKPIGFYFKPVP